MIKNFFINIIFFCIILSFPSCISWPRGWDHFQNKPKKGNLSFLLTKAKKQELKANTKKKFFELIKTYERIIKIDPQNKRILLNLGAYYFLAGYGYSTEKNDKEKYYHQSLFYFEKVMYLNPAFKLLIDTDNDVWEACRVLTKNELEAMLGWYFSSYAYLGECLSAPGKIFNLNWVTKEDKIITKIMELDPGWGDGIVFYALACRYASLPKILGGDLKKAEEYFVKAIKLGPKMLNFRRTRAKYLYLKTKNKKAFLKDLKWVVAQNPYKAGLTYPFNAFIQRDAQQMLENIDLLFE